MKKSLLTLSSLVLFSGIQAADQVIQKTTQSSVLEINEENFTKLANADKPLILDVWGEWCAPCKKMKPIFDELAQNRTDCIFGSLDMQKNEEIVKQLQVRALPTFIVIKSGKEYGRVVGAVVSSSQELRAKIDECLKNENPKKLGEAVALAPQEIFMKLISLAQLPSKEAQVKAVEDLFANGMTADMVLVDMPAMGDRPARKMTPISLLIGTNKEIVQVLVDHGADINQIITEIDNNLDLINAELKKMNELKAFLKK